MDIAIQKAETKLRTVSQDDEALRIYEMREKALSDWTSGVNHARREGIKEGIEKWRAEGEAKGEVKGHTEERLEIARKMKEMGDSIEKIQTITGLPPEAIKQM